MDLFVYIPHSLAALYLSLVHPVDHLLSNTACENNICVLANHLEKSGSTEMVLTACLIDLGIGEQGKNIVLQCVFL